jgi:hypothetical protein
MTLKSHHVWRVPDTGTERTVAPPHARTADGRGCLEDVIALVKEENEPANRTVLDKGEIGDGFRISIWTDLVDIPSDHDNLHVHHDVRYDVETRRIWAAEAWL